MQMIAQTLMNRFVLCCFCKDNVQINQAMNRRVQPENRERLPKLEENDQDSITLGKCKMQEDHTDHSQVIEPQSKQLGKQQKRKKTQKIKLDQQQFFLQQIKCKKHSSSKETNISGSNRESRHVTQRSKDENDIMDIAVSIHPITENSEEQSKFQWPRKRKARIWNNKNTNSTMKSKSHKKGYSQIIKINRNIPSTEVN